MSPQDQLLKACQVDKKKVEKAKHRKVKVKRKNKVETVEKQGTCLV
ncbi:MAG: hypothetical protein R6X15_07060 [Pseudomonadota bacterium]